MKYFRRYADQMTASPFGLLPLEERGAHVTLCDLYALSETPLPKNENEIFLLAHTRNKREKIAIKNVLEKFWKLTEEGWIHEPILEQIQAYARTCERNREIAIKREEDYRATRGEHATCTSGAPKINKTKKKVTPSGRRAEGAQPSAEDLKNGLEVYITAMTKHHGVKPTITVDINTKIENLLRKFSLKDAVGIIQARIRTEGDL